MPKHLTIRTDDTYLGNKYSMVRMKVVIIFAEKNNNKYILLRLNSWRKDYTYRRYVDLGSEYGMVRIMKVEIIFPEKNENKWLRLNSRRKIHGTYVW